MTALDWVLLIIWLGITLSGFWKGAIRLVFGVGGLIAGIALALTAGPYLVEAIEPHVGARWMATALGYAGPFLVSILVCMAAAWGLDRTLSALHLGWLNRLTGAGLAGLAAAIILALVVVTGARYSSTWATACARSSIPPYLITLLQQLPTADGEPPPAEPDPVRPGAAEQGTLPDDASEPLPAVPPEAPLPRAGADQV